MKKEVKDSLLIIGGVAIFFGCFMLANGLDYLFEEPVRILSLVFKAMLIGAAVGGFAILVNMLREGRFAKSGISTLQPSPSRSGTIRTSSALCCICGKDMTGKPVMQDRMTGAVYCPQHSGYFDALKDPSLFSSCSNCGFKYSRSYSEFAKVETPKCPRCGTSLK